MITQFLGAFWFRPDVEKHGLRSVAMIHAKSVKQTNAEDNNIDALLAEAEEIKNNADKFITFPVKARREVRELAAA